MASDRRPFLLRVDPDLLAAVQRWANDDLRSVNGQVEFLLRRALAQAGRAPTRRATDATRDQGEGDAGDRGAE